MLLHYQVHLLLLLILLLHLHGQEQVSCLHGIHLIKLHVYSSTLLLQYSTVQRMDGFEFKCLLAHVLLIYLGTWKINYKQEHDEPEQASKTLAVEQP